MTDALFFSPQEVHPQFLSVLFFVTREPQRKMSLFSLVRLYSVAQFGRGAGLWGSLR